MGEEVILNEKVNNIPFLDQNEKINLTLMSVDDNTAQILIEGYLPSGYS